MATASERPREQVPMVRINEPASDPAVNRPKPPPLEMSSAGPSLDLPKTPTRKEKEKKIGHRRVDDTGQVTYKKKSTSELMAAIQLGIGQSITILSTKPKRDLLLQDFSVVELVFFPREGSNLTPAHHYSDFRFKTFAPIAFRYFRELFSIQPDDFLLSLCNEALLELSNPGASGSIFYITNDDEFIIKTVQHKEAEFLQKLLPGYYMNLNQNPRTLLPKFYGLYCYQCGGKNIRFVVMNNLLPSSVRMHEKYDMKGSTYKRKASRKEKQKRSPTLKDLDFLENHPEGIMLEADTYNALINTINRDCRVLQSFKIMDYSLLLGIHNLDIASRTRQEDEASENGGGGGGADTTTGGEAASSATPRDRHDTHNTSISRGKSMRQRVAQYSTAMEAIAATTEPLELDNEDIPPGGIPARNSKGERLLLYIGLIDILQYYRFGKKLEHTFKAMVHDGDTISVHRPGFYANRFQSFFSNTVFKKIPSSLKQSPSKKRAMTGGSVAGMTPGTATMGVGGRQRSITGTSEFDMKSPDHLSSSASSRTTRSYNIEDAAHGGALGATGGRPDLLPENSTPPPTFAEALSDQKHSRHSGQHTHEVLTTSPAFHHRGDSGGLGMLHSPVHSIAESTPTHTEYTEGTPSFTTSSPSCSSDMLDSLPSTTKSTRREFSSNNVTTSSSPAAGGGSGGGGGITSTSLQQQQQRISASLTSAARTSSVEVTHEDIEFALPGGKALDIPAHCSTAAERGDSGDRGEVISHQQQETDNAEQPDQEDQQQQKREKPEN